MHEDCTADSRKYTLANFHGILRNDKDRFGVTS